jgi:hypothetical protein
MPKRRDNRRSLRQVLAGAAASVAGFPFVSRAQNKPIKIGMPTIQSRRAAMVGS